MLGFFAFIEWRWFLPIKSIIHLSTEVEGGNIIPTVRDVCASFQYAITKHLVRQTQKAMVYVDVRGLLPKQHQTLVC